MSPVCNVDMWKVASSTVLEVCWYLHAYFDITTSRLLPSRHLRRNGSVSNKNHTYHHHHHHSLRQNENKNDIIQFTSPNGLEVVTQLRKMCPFDYQFTSSPPQPLTHLPIYVTIAHHRNPHQNDHNKNILTVTYQYGLT